MRQLTVKEQIQVLKNIDWNFLEKSKEGLCVGIRMSIWNKIHLEVPSYRIKEIIPLFTRENAFEFGVNHYSIYWWPLNIEGYECRKRFVEGMISELKQQLKVTLNEQEGLFNECHSRLDG